MLRVSIHEYKLTPLIELNSKSLSGIRKGALLKVEWPHEEIGYGDIFPWPELGDLPLEKHLSELRESRISPLMKQSLWTAKRDALARAQNKNMIAEHQKVKNHFLVTHLINFSEEEFYRIKADGFSTVKIKVGRDWTKEFSFIQDILLQSEFQIRLDFNLGGDPLALATSLKSLPEKLLEKIEFIEDPFSFDLVKWTHLSKIVPLAIDEELGQLEKFGILNQNSICPFKYLVIKPARQPIEKWVAFASERNLKMVFTSSMDHAVGVTHAAVAAAETKEHFPDLVTEGGLLTTELYSPDDFTRSLTISGPYLTQVKGVGVGFDEIFKGLPWVPLLS